MKGLSAGPADVGSRAQNTKMSKMARIPNPTIAVKTQPMTRVVSRNTKRAMTKATINNRTSPTIEKIKSMVMCPFSAYGDSRFT